MHKSGANKHLGSCQVVFLVLRLLPGPVSLKLSFCSYLRLFRLEEGIGSVVGEPSWDAGVSGLSSSQIDLREQMEVRT